MREKIEESAENLSGRVHYEIPQIIEKKIIEAQFSKNANHYDDIAIVQRRIADRLVNMIMASSALHSDLLRLDPSSDDTQSCTDMPILNPHSYSILDAGCGTGYLGRRLRAQIHHTRYTTLEHDAQYSPRVLDALQFIALDISPEMLAVARSYNHYHAYIAKDIETLANQTHKNDCPITALGPFDLVMSSLAVQWCHDLQLALSALQSITQGREDHFSIFLTTLAEGTLQELAVAFKAVDDEQHILSFLTEVEITKIITKLGGEVSFYSEVIQFPDLKSLFKSIRAIGATSLPNRRKGLLGKNDYQKINDYFKALGRYQLTYRVAEIKLPGKV